MKHLQKACDLQYVSDLLLSSLLSKRFHVARTRFGHRFGFALWLHHLRTGRALPWSKIGEAVGRTGQAVSAWPEQEEAPTDWKIQEPLSQLLGASVEWLIKDQGEPPMPDLWDVWLRTRQKEDRARAKEMSGFEAQSSKPAAKKGRLA